MNPEQKKTLAAIIRNGWKELAKGDQSEGEEMLAVAVQILEAMEKLEASE